jgi:hypothetical protein
MRFFEFDLTESSLDKFIMILNHEVGNYARRGTPAKLNWANVAQLAQKSGFEMLGDPNRGYETFKAIYDSTPAVQKLVKNFNANGLELNVPGAPDADEAEQDGSNSQDEINKQAASAAPQQVDQAQQTPQT